MVVVYTHTKKRLQEEDSNKMYWMHCVAASGYFLVNEYLRTGKEVDALRVCDEVLVFSGDDQSRVLSGCAYDIHVTLPQASPRPWRKAKEVDVQVRYLLETTLEEPSLPEFAGLVKCQQAVVLKGCMEDWPCLLLWKEVEYMGKMLHGRTMPMEYGMDFMAQDWTLRMTKGGVFMEKMLLDEGDKTNPCISQALNREQHDCTQLSPQIYLAQHTLFKQIPRLAQDILEPIYLTGLSQEAPIAQMWMGPERTASRLHFDKYHNLLCQVVGRKYVRLYSSELDLNPDPGSPNVRADYYHSQNLPLCT